MSWPVAGDPACDHLLTPQASNLLVHLSVPSTPGIPSITDTPLLVQDLPLLPQRFPQRPPGHPHPGSAASPATGPTPPQLHQLHCSRNKTHPGKSSILQCSPPRGLQARKERGAAADLGALLCTVQGDVLFGSFFLPTYSTFSCGIVTSLLNAFSLKKFTGLKG